MKTMLFGIACILFAIGYGYLSTISLSLFDDLFVWVALFLGMLLVILGDRSEK